MFKFSIWAYIYIMLAIYVAFFSANLSVPTRCFVVCYSGQTPVISVRVITLKVTAHYISIVTAIIRCRPLYNKKKYTLDQTSNFKSSKKQQQKKKTRPITTLFK